MKVECTTDILDFFDPGTYWSGMADNCKTNEDAEILDRALEEAAQDMFTLIFPDCITSNVKIIHPREYNFTDDVIEFELTMTDDKFDKLRKKCDKFFFEWIEAKWHSYNGFICFMPTEKIKFNNALDHNGRRYEFDQAVQMMLAYEHRDRFDKKTNKNFWNRVVTIAEREGLNLYADE